MASVDDRRNDLLQRVHLYGLSVTSRRDLGKLGTVLIGDEIGLRPAAASAILRDESSCCGIEHKEYGDDDDDDNGEDGGKEEQDKEDTATTCSYGFQMRGFLRRMTALSTSLVSCARVQRPEASLLIIPAFDIYAIQQA